MNRLALKNVYTFEYFEGGRLVWQHQVKNLIVDEGLNDVLEQYYNGSGYTAAHFVGLLSASPTIAPGDTMAAHPGWSEIEDYDEAARPALNMGTAASKIISNTANKAAFSINAAVTIGGAFQTTDATKGAGGGTLIGAVAFSGGPEAMNPGGTLNVTVQTTASSS